MLDRDELSAAAPSGANAMQDFEDGKSIMIGRVLMQVIVMPDAVLQNLALQGIRLAGSLFDGQEDAADATSAIGWPRLHYSSCKQAMAELLDTRLD